MIFALVALIAFYRGEHDGESYPVQDDAYRIGRSQQSWSQHHDRQTNTEALVKFVLGIKEHWERDLTRVFGLMKQAFVDLDTILAKGIREAAKSLC